MKQFGGCTLQVVLYQHCLVQLHLQDVYGIVQLNPTTQTPHVIPVEELSQLPYVSQPYHHHHHHHLTSQIVRNWGLAVAVDYLELFWTVEVQVEHSLVAVSPPPVTQLPVPATGEGVEEFRVVKGNQSVEILVSQVALETVVLCSFHQLGSLLIALCTTTMEQRKRKNT
ncbi:hypothetical protein E2C01_022684 [Portunus trituberculatus]|uniref:Uncharacterized protein n=1 Tax=Portunus trituberculatus TaxID=210409 RepID=A0A5B7E612_PORTR|nr:hypothetical protein [Portunus trituberculatus]